MNKLLLLTTALLIPDLGCAAETTCTKAPTCSELGYTQTSSECSGRTTVKCPFDETKLFCGTNAMIGEVRMWAGSTVPKGWKRCDGSSLSRTTYKALYDVIGTNYGSGNSSTFKLPNFGGKVPIGVGYGSSSAYHYVLGSTGGEEKHTLTVSEMPSHNHGWTGVVGIGYPDGAGDTTGAGSGHSYPRQSQQLSVGGGQSHENRMPYLGIYFIIYTGV